MIAVALKGLAGRKVRALLTAFAVVIGVTMVSGTLVLTDTIQKAFDGIFTASYEQTDAVIAGKEIVKGSAERRRDRPRVAAREGPGAARGRGGRRHDRADRVQQGRDLRPRRQAASAPATRPSSGSATTRPSRSSARSSSRPASGRRDRSRSRSTPGTAAGENFEVGDTVAVSTLGAKRRYEVTGIATFGDVDSLGGATMAIWDLPTAQTLLDKQGRFDGISIAAKDGTSPDELVRAVQPLVPASLEVKDSEAQAAADAEETNVHRQRRPLLPAGLRRDRAVRRRVRDLQHAVDHRRPAHARVRDAADPRGLAQAGHALGRDRGPGDRAAGLGGRALRRARARQAADRRSAATSRRPGWCSRRGRSSSRSRSAP